MPKLRLWPTLRPVPRASEMEYPESQAKCVASSATGLLCSGARPSPSWGPSNPFHCSQRAWASAATEFQASTIPLLPCLTPHPPEPHLRRCHGNGERQALAAKGAPERGPRLRLGRGGVQQAQTSKPSVPRAAASPTSALGRGGGCK